MENCFICEKHKTLKSLTKFNDQDLSIRDKINETFSINFDDSQILSKLKICKTCIQEVTTCHNFYQLVRKAQDRLTSEIECDVNALVKVEIKLEPKEDDYESQEFDFFQSFEVNEDAITDEKDELVDVRRRKRERTSKADKPRKYRKLSPDERKSRGNRGIRRAKEAIKITTAYLYEKELKGKFIETPDELQITDEDKLKNGVVSERITSTLSAASWQTAYEWKCTEMACVQVFPNILDLNKHLHKVHRIKYRTTCGMCLKPTQHYAAFLNHIIEQHVQNNKFCCIVCPKPTFIWNLKDLYLHYAKIHKIKNLNFCLYCGLHFHCGARLKEHLIHKHNKINDRAECFECDFCGFKTEQRSRIKSHMVRHVVPTHLCYLCSATFTDSGYLSTHLRQVHSELQIQCPKCEKVFKTHKRLRCHFQTVHEEEKPFLCEICNKRFAARHRLNIHLRIHRDQREESYQCAYCERKFKYKPGMLYHERAAHTGEQPYKCPIEGCFERFYDFSNAKKHISGRHNSSLRPILEHL